MCIPRTCLIPTFSPSQCARCGSPTVWSEHLVTPQGKSVTRVEDGVNRSHPTCSWIDALIPVCSLSADRGLPRSPGSLSPDRLVRIDWRRTLTLRFARSWRKVRRSQAWFGIPWRAWRGSPEHERKSRSDKQFRDLNSGADVLHGAQREPNCSRLSL